MWYLEKTNSTQEGKVSFFAFILRLTMTSVFDRQDGRKSERDELATEVADDARDFCKW